MIFFGGLLLFDYFCLWLGMEWTFGHLDILFSTMYPHICESK